MKINYKHILSAIFLSVALLGAYTLPFARVWSIDFFVVSSSIFMCLLAHLKLYSMSLVVEK
jgi:hypothetical protein